MAIITAKKTLKGKVGEVYQREFRGKQIVQVNPKRSKQDKKKNVNAPLMKHTSHHSSLLRKYIEVYLGNRHESFMHSRFLGKLLTAVHSNKELSLQEKNIFNVDCGPLEGFEFNTKVLFKDTFLPKIEVEKISESKIKVTVPAFVPKEQVVFPKDCTEAIVRFCVLSLESQFVVYQSKAIDIASYQGYFEFKINDPFIEEKVFVFDIPSFDEKVEVIVSDIQFYYPINDIPVRLALYNSKTCNPSTLVYAK